MECLYKNNNNKPEQQVSFSSGAPRRRKRRECPRNRNAALQCGQYINYGVDVSTWRGTLAGARRRDGQLAKGRRLAHDRPDVVSIHVGNYAGILPKRLLETAVIKELDLAAPEIISRSCTAAARSRWVGRQQQQLAIRSYVPQASRTRPWYLRPTIIELVTRRYRLCCLAVILRLKWTSEDTTLLSRISGTNSEEHFHSTIVIRTIVLVNFLSGEEIKHFILRTDAEFLNSEEVIYRCQRGMWPDGASNCLLYSKNAPDETDRYR
ncbi:hypothetical protein J6590_042505 [Homalodisca vitripennis]|nr:hypothetical protein J6590_042505 [Homalodisca vitripennis]